MLVTNFFLSPLFILIQPSMYPTELSRVVCIITLPSEKARELGPAVWDSLSPVSSKFKYFYSGNEEIFDRLQVEKLPED